MRRNPLWALTVVVLLLGSACSGSGSGPQGQEPPSSGTSLGGTKTPDANPTPDVREGAVTKLLVFVVENHSFDQVRDGMPYTFKLAERFGYAANYYALTHPSLPNYIGITGGQTYGITDDDPPSSHPVDGQSVFGQALALGKTARVYAEGMPNNCATEDGGDKYAVRHNPWTYFVSEQESCKANDVPIGDLGPAVADGTLPNIGMVVPDMCNIAHDCDLSVADAWFKDHMSRIFDGPDWRSGHLAVVLTADEDDSSQNNQILTVVIHPSQQGNVVDQRLNHYSLTRLYEDVVHAPHLYEARSAASMSDAFGLPIN